MAVIAQRDRDLCCFCGVCRNNVICPAGEVFSPDCYGCGACVHACPGRAINLIEDKYPGKTISIQVNGKRYTVPGRITLKKALEITGTLFFDHDTSCNTGGCWNCVVLADDNPEPACITGVRDGMVIETGVKVPPVRVVSGFSPHMVGGVGTPIEVRNYEFPIEVACFTHGCNLTCPGCQNHSMAFSGGPGISPGRVAGMLSNMRKIYNVNRMAFSGGECTLNRPWLIQAIETLRHQDRDENVRIHVDTNGSILTGDYIDELVLSGMTDIGIDLKGSRVGTFQRITGIEDIKTAGRYLKNAWNSVEYILDNHPGIFVGTGIPYNREFMSGEEISEIGERLACISKDVQVCVLDYRSAFRKSLIPPAINELKHVKNILNRTGLKNVIVQTPNGHIGP